MYTQRNMIYFKFLSKIDDNLFKVDFLDSILQYYRCHKEQDIVCHTLSVLCKMFVHFEIDLSAWKKSIPLVNVKRRLTIKLSKTK